ENSSRGIWSIAPDKRHIETIDPHEIVRAVREADSRKRASEAEPEETGAEENGTDELPTWKETVYHVLTQKITPDAFERLTQRLLRESGFIHVEIAGKSGDGGIDGKGIARINGILSFHVIFQCKRYQGAVSASQIRDFRGAMVGRADKGLFITTGTFTRDAI